MYYNILQIQIENTEYQDPEERIYVNICMGHMKATVNTSAYHPHPNIIQVVSIDTNLI